MSRDPSNEILLAELCEGNVLPEFHDEYCRHSARSADTMREFAAVLGVSILGALGRLLTRSTKPMRPSELRAVVAKMDRGERLRFGRLILGLEGGPVSSGRGVTGANSSSPGSASAPV